MKRNPCWQPRTRSAAQAPRRIRGRLGGARRIDRALCADRDHLTGLRLEAVVGFYCLPVGAVNHVQAPAPVKIRAWRATRSRSWSSRDAGWATGAGGSAKVYSRTPGGRSRRARARPASACGTSRQLRVLSADIRWKGRSGGGGGREGRRARQGGSRALRHSRSTRSSTIVHRGYRLGAGIDTGHTPGAGLPRCVQFPINTQSFEPAPPERPEPVRTPCESDAAQDKP